MSPWTKLDNRLPPLSGALFPTLTRRALCPYGDREQISLQNSLTCHWTFFLAERQHRLDENCPLHVEHTQQSALKLPRLLDLVSSCNQPVNWQSLWQRQLWLLKKNRCLGNPAEEAVEVEKWTLLAPSGPGACCFGREPSSGGTGPYAAAIHFTEHHLWILMALLPQAPSVSAHQWGLSMGWQLPSAPAGLRFAYSSHAQNKQVDTGTNHARNVSGLPCLSHPAIALQPALVHCSLLLLLF